MNKILKLILLLVIGYIIYLNLPVSNCEKVLTFKVENIDRQFGLSKENAVNYTKAAAEIWNKGLQKQVLKYDENGEIKISFVYDERQRKTIQNNILKE